MLVESLTGNGPRDARLNRLLKTCATAPLDIVTPSGLVIAGGADDISRLADHAHGVAVMSI